MNPVSNEVEELKRKYAKREGLKKVPRTSDVRELLAEKKLEAKTRAVRSLSGVCVIAIMPKPAPCPGKCSYCPTAEGAPKSYTGFEPAAMRAKQNDFDAFKQVSARLSQLKAIGHEPSKCELIIMGGTFNSLPEDYQREFVKRAFDAFNEGESSSLERAQEANESARHKVVGLTVETRPDYCKAREVARFLEFGATRVELGVQSLDEEVLARVQRGHGVAEVAEATREAKNAFLKVCFHLMPGLYADARKDAAMFKELFADPRFRPDMLKIYPALVLPGTRLYEEWKKGEYEPYSTEEAARAVAECKRFVPRYCRIMRVDRDIPTRLIAAGVKKTNLRELAKEIMKEKGTRCECIRCREIGFKQLKEGITLDCDAIELNRFDYEASGGREIFLSFDDETNDALVALLRLRANADGKCGVRELRVFGEQVPVGERKARALQHKKFGEKLLAEAGEIARSEFGARELLVLSGVGARPYYARLGFAKKGFYMAKEL